MTGDMGEIFNDLKALKQAKRASNREQNAAILQHSGCLFETRNAGAHLIVQAGPHLVDFWPGTGLWIVRQQTAKHRGVRKLVNFVERARQSGHNKGI